MAAKKPAPPVKDEAWVRKRDRVVVNIDAVTRTKVTVCTRVELLVYDYSHEAFHRNFRTPRTPLGPRDMFEPERKD